MTETMLDAWVQHALDMSVEPNTMYAASRKVIRGRSLVVPLDDSIELGDAGYTNAKLKMLMRHYLHEESRDVAVKLWEHRRGKKKYGSVSFTTFNHYIKGKGTVEEIIAGIGIGSVFGPCIQSVCITWVNRNEVAIDVFYRTTEFFKKFPADLVFIRDVLLAPFDIPSNSTMRLHFANITIHPMYFVTIIPHLRDPMAALENVRKADPRFWRYIVSWTARYVVPERTENLMKFAQGMRVRKDVYDRIPKHVLRKLVPYVQKHYDARNAPDDDEDDDG